MKGSMHNASVKPQAGGSSRQFAESETTRLRELPPELKDQVERAMADMKERSLERKAQFIDGRHGKK
jgi:hypothetical protein